jgi:hypothetical protein
MQFWSLFSYSKIYPFAHYKSICVGGRGWLYFFIPFSLCHKTAVGDHPHISAVWNSGQYNIFWIKDDINKWNTHIFLLQSKLKKNTFFFRVEWLIGRFTVERRAEKIVCVFLKTIRHIWLIVTKVKVNGDFRVKFDSVECSEALSAVLKILNASR